MRMNWQYKPTGDMTLSVVDADTGERVLTVDMLAAGTTKAGTDGDVLARTVNDLTLLADVISKRPHSIPHPSAGYSPFPWQVVRSGKDLKRVSVLDADNKKIAGRKDGMAAPTLHRGVLRINELDIAQLP